MQVTDANQAERTVCNQHGGTDSVCVCGGRSGNAACATTPEYSSPPTEGAGGWVSAEGAHQCVKLRRVSQQLHQRTTGPARGTARRHRSLNKAALGVTCTAAVALLRIGLPRTFRLQSKCVQRLRV
jgi:hypothetical protein